MVLFWQECCGKGNLRKFYWSTLGKKFLIGTACVRVPREGLILICVCG